MQKYFREVTCQQTTRQEEIANGRGPAPAEEDRGQGQGRSGIRQVVVVLSSVFFSLFWVAVSGREHRQDQQSSRATIKDRGPHPDPTTGRGGD